MNLNCKYCLNNIILIKCIISFIIYKYSFLCFLIQFVPLNKYYIDYNFVAKLTVSEIHLNVHYIRFCTPYNYKIQYM